MKNQATKTAPRKTLTLRERFEQLSADFSHLQIQNDFLTMQYEHRATLLEDAQNSVATDASSLTTTRRKNMAHGVSRSEQDARIAVRALLEILHVIEQDGMYRDAEFIEQELRKCGVNEADINYHKKPQ